VDSDTNAANEINLTDATVRGLIFPYRGQDSRRVPNVMFSFGDAQVFTASLLPSIGIPDVDAILRRTTLSMSWAIRLLRRPRTSTCMPPKASAAKTGRRFPQCFVAVPCALRRRGGYGKASVTSNNEVNVADTAYLEAGINNQARIHTSD